jgi:tRNA threonylcarbamoyladenosine biosynthesis protein TsaE
MPRAEHLTRDPSETEALGAALAAALRPGDVVLLHGEMGTGKTTFVRGALRALGVAGPVTSPTFTLGRRYDAGRIPSAHLDLHRLGALDDEDPGLLDPYVEPARVAFVEWPETARAELRAQARLAAEVTLEHAGGDLRRVTVEREPGAP